MIKPEDRFHSFCGRSFMSHKLIMTKKYKISEWIHSKNAFYTDMYNKNSIYKTIFYAKLK